MAKRNPPITAVEIGTGTVKVVIGIPEDDGTFTIAGYSEQPSGTRVRKGEVVDMDGAGEALSQALTAAESAAGCRIEAVYLAVTGRHIGCVNVQGTVPITAPDRVITEDDVVAATRHAMEHSLPMHKIKVNSFQCSYIIDNVRRISQPIGMVANNLSADIHVIHGDRNIIDTQCKLLEQVLGSEADDIAFSGIANFYGCVDIERSRKGILVADIGAGVTEYAIFHNEGCVHSGQLTVGCDHLANDLSIGLGIPIARARDVLREHGTALCKADSAKKSIVLQVLLSDPPRRFTEAAVATVIELRMRELFEIIRDDLVQSDVAGCIGDGVILSGGGALIPEIGDLCGAVFSLPVRIGRPLNITGEDALCSPRFVTPVGLLHLGLHLGKLEQQRQLPLKEQMKRDLQRFYSVIKRAFQV